MLKPLRVRLLQPTTITADAEGRPIVATEEIEVRANAGLLGVTREVAVTGSTQHGAVGMVHRAWATLHHKDTNGVVINPSIGATIVITERAAAGTWEIDGLEHTTAHWRVGLVRRAV